MGLILVALIQYPSLFIKKSAEYKSFEIYSNDNIALSENVKSILDSVLANLKESKFRKEDDKYKLYFVRGTLYEKLIRLFGAKNLASSKYSTHIYSATPDFRIGKLIRTNNDYDWLNLVQIITHECIQTQMYSDYSNFGIMQTPSWIIEGYCDYISYSPIRNQNSYDLSSLFNKLENNNEEWIRTEYNTMTPRHYATSRLLIEFLIDVKGLEITEIISDKSLEPEKVYEEIRDYFKDK